MIINHPLLGPRDLNEFIYYGDASLLKRPKWDDKNAEDKFKEASEAYGILSDKSKKENYDNFGHAAFENGGGGQGGCGGVGGFSGADFSDIFEDFFGDFGGGGRRSSRGRSSNNRGSDLRYDLSITLEEAYLGKKQNIQFSTSDKCCLLYTSPSPRDATLSRMPSSA